MDKEMLRARQPAAKQVIPSAYPLWYQATTNTVAFMRGQNMGGDVLPLESGRPDWIVLRPHSMNAFVEFKQAEGSVDLLTWRDNQREWYYTWPTRTEHDYYIALWISWDTHITRANHDRASFFWVPAEVWLETERLAENTWGIRTVYCMAENAPSTRRDFDLFTLWGQWKLERKDGKWVLPESHPLHPKFIGETNAAYKIL
jgi:hypothetical protein